MLSPTYNKTNSPRNPPDCAKVQFDYKVSNEKIKKATANIRVPDNENQIKLRLPHTSGLEILAKAQGTEKKGSKLDDKELLEILRKELRDQEDVKILLFKHCKLANAEVERLNNAQIDMEKLLQEKELKIEGLGKIEAENAELRNKLKTTPNFVENNRKLVVENQKIRKELIQQRRENELLSSSITNLKTGWADCEKSIKESEESVCSIFDQLVEHLNAASIQSELVIEGKNFFEKISVVGKLLEKLQEQLEEAFRYKASHAQFIINIGKLQKKLDQTEVNLQTGKREYGDLQKLFKGLQDEHNNLKNDHSQLQTTLHVKEGQIQNFKAKATEHIYLENDLLELKKIVQSQEIQIQNYRELQDDHNNLQRDFLGLKSILNDRDRKIKMLREVEVDHKNLQYNFRHVRKLLQDRDAQIQNFNKNKDKYEDLLLEFSALQDNLETSKRNFDSQKQILTQHLEDVLQNLEQEKIASAKTLAEQTLRYANIVNHWKTIAYNNSDLENLSVTYLENCAKEKTCLKQKIFDVMSNNSQKIENNVSTLLTVISPMFEDEINFSAVMPKPLVEGSDLNLDENIKIFSDKIDFVCILLRFINEKLFEQSLIIKKEPMQTSQDSSFFIDDEFILESAFPNLPSDLLMDLSKDEGACSKLTEKEMEEKFTALALGLMLDFQTSKARLAKQSEHCDKIFTKLTNSVNFISELIKGDMTPKTRSAVSYMRYLKGALQSAFQTTKQYGAIEYEVKTMFCWNLVTNYVASIKKELDRKSM